MCLSYRKENNLRNFPDSKPTKKNRKYFLTEERVQKIQFKREVVVHGSSKDQAESEDDKSMVNLDDSSMFDVRFFSC